MQPNISFPKQSQLFYFIHLQDKGKKIKIGRTTFQNLRANELPILPLMLNDDQFQNYIAQYVTNRNLTLNMSNSQNIVADSFLISP